MLLTSLLVSFSVTMSPAADPGEDLIRRINAAHRGSWFTSLIFVQRTTWPGTPRPEETWYETMLRPGMLRIDIDRAGQPAGGLVFRNDSIYQFTPTESRPGRLLVHPLLLLLHDVHVGSADVIVSKLRSLGFDLSKTSTNSWQGKPVTVVGAASGDSTSAQFWVDDAALVVVRILQPGQGGAMSDTQIPKFSAEGPALVEREIRFHTGTTVTLVEEYMWVRTGVALDAVTFDPANRTRPAWIAEYLKSGGK